MKKNEKKVLLLVNSAAGTGTARGKLYEIIEYRTTFGCQVVTYPVLPEKGLDSEEIIRRHGTENDIIMCCGGDGTLNHVISSMMRLGIMQPLGYVPSGSTNDFAKSIGIPGDLGENCKAIVKGDTFAYDIGRFNDAYFNYVAAFGAFTKVSYSTKQTTKNVLGYAAYILESIHSLPESMTSRCHMRIEHDGIVDEGYYLYGAISNATSVGGISSAMIRKASLNDGLFEVMLIAAPDNIVEVGEIITTLASGSTENRNVKLFTASHLSIQSIGDVSWTLDGEYGGTPESVEIEVCPRAIRMLVP